MTYFLNYLRSLHDQYLSRVPNARLRCPGKLAGSGDWEDREKAVGKTSGQWIVLARAELSQISDCCLTNAKKESSLKSPLLRTDWVIGQMDRNP